MVTIILIVLLALSLAGNLLHLRAVQARLGFTPHTADTTDTADTGKGDEYGPPYPWDPWGTR